MCKILRHYIEIQDLKIDKPLQKLALQTIVRTDFESKEIFQLYEQDPQVEL